MPIRFCAALFFFCVSCRIIFHTAMSLLWSWTWFSSADCIHLRKWFIRNCHPLTRQSASWNLSADSATPHTFLLPFFYSLFSSLPRFLCVVFFSAMPWKCHFQRTSSVSAAFSSVIVCHSSFGFAFCCLDWVCLRIHFTLSSLKCREKWRKSYLVKWITVLNGFSIWLSNYPIFIVVMNKFTKVNRTQWHWTPM